LVALNLLLKLADSLARFFEFLIALGELGFEVGNAGG
jgi:hypothetical protein